MHLSVLGSSIDNLTTTSLTMPTKSNFPCALVRPQNTYLYLVMRMITSELVSLITASLPFFILLKLSTDIYTSPPLPIPHPTTLNINASTSAALVGLFPFPSAVSLPAISLAKSLLTSSPLFPTAFCISNSKSGRRTQPSLLSGAGLPKIMSWILRLRRSLP